MINLVSTVTIKGSRSGYLSCDYCAFCLVFQMFELLGFEISSFILDKN